MIIQCWHIRETGVGTSVHIGDYPDNVASHSVMGEAVKTRLAMVPGLYVVTRPEKASGGSPYVDSLTCYTLHNDMTWTRGAQTRLPRLVSWPPKQPRSKE